MPVIVSHVHRSPTRFARSYKEATQGRHLQREDFEEDRIDGRLFWGCVAAVLFVSYLGLVA